MHNNQWLALETSTDTLSLAVSRGTQTWTHTSAGGALTSTHMIPHTLALLKEAGLALTDLQAVVFGRGPGAFTGLRTACAVAQGLAFGANLPVLPIDTLLAVAEEARAAAATTGAAPVTRVLAVMDARMEQLYVAAYEFTPNATNAATGDAEHMHGTWRCVQAPELHSPESLHWPADWVQDSFIAAGNAWPVYAGRWPAALSAPQVLALPTVSELMSSLPVTGLDGTMKRSKAQASAHLKTGSLRDVAGVAGYVDTASGKRLVVVAILHHANANAARPALDAMIDWAGKQP